MVFAKIKDRLGRSIFSPSNAIESRFHKPHWQAKLNYRQAQLSWRSALYDLIVPDLVRKVHRTRENRKRSSQARNTFHIRLRTYQVKHQTQQVRLECIKSNC